MRFQRGATANVKTLIVLILGLAVCSNGIPLTRGANRNSSAGARPAPTSATSSTVERPAVEKRDRSSKPDAETLARINENYGRLPLSFEANLGQAHEAAKFLARGPGYNLVLAADKAFLFLKNRQIRMKLLNANPHANVIGVDQLPGRSNYYLGTDPTKWRTNVPHYSKVKYEAVYPGIDMVYYGNQQELEYDFIVSPGTDSRKIKINFAGVRQLRIDRNGELVMKVKGDEVRQHRPVAYQEIAGQRQEIESRYVLNGKHSVGFAVGAYDVTKPLVIDPVLTYSTLLGGTGRESGRDIAIDSNGNAYVTGQTNANNFPVINAAQPFWGGGFDSSFRRLYDVFITKLNPTGDQFLYSTYLGGNTDDFGGGIDVDDNGNAYVTGTTNGNFPQLNGIQSPFARFAAKLDTNGGLVYSTYLRGAGSEVVVDSSGCPYFVGIAGAGATTVNAFQPTFGGGNQDVFIQKLNAAGTTVLFASYLGGSGDESGTGIALDSANNIYVTGAAPANFPVVNAYQPSFAGERDAFLAKVSSATNTLVYSTYLGGSADDFAEGVAVDGDGNGYITGETYSHTNFPVTAGVFQTTWGGDHPGFCGGTGCGDAFVAKFNPSGNSLVYSTRIGGIDDDGGEGIAVDASGNAYVLGTTSAPNFPVVNGLQHTFNCCATDMFVTKLNAAGSAALYSTYYGSPTWEFFGDIAIDSAGAAYITGETYADELNGALPLVNPAQSTFGGAAQQDDQDAFIAKISDIEGFILSGQVKDPGDNPVAGVTMTLSGSRTRTALTDSNGNYSFIQLGPGENLTVTPSKNLYTFSPTSQTFNNLSQNETANFTGTPLSQFSISGHIQHSDSSNVAGAIVNLSGSQVRTTITDASGNYAFTLLVEGESFVVTPTMPISYTLTYTFSPLSQSFNNLNANQTANFTRSSATNLTIYPVADATVQDGVGASTNFGKITPMLVKKANQADQRRDAYLKFDLTSITRTITNAKLRIFAGLSVDGSVVTSVHSVTDTTWSETAITWANKPAISGTPITGANATVTSTTYAVYDIDITSHIVAQKAAGAELVSLALHNGSNSTPHIELNSREAATNKPALFITTSDNNNAAPTVSLTGPTNGASFTSPGPVPLSATASDSDGSVSKVEFYAGTKLVGSATTSPYTASWSNVDVGAYSIIAVATDNSGSATASGAAGISVAVPNPTPSVTVTSPQTNTIFPAGSSLTLTADATDVNGTVTQVEFLTGSTSIGTDTSAPYSVPWNNIAAGSHSITARATDNNGGIATSPAITVNIVWQTGLSPTLDAYVRDGSSAATNFGTAQELQVQQGAAGSNREAHFRFDLTAVTNIVKAKLRVRGRLSDTSGTNVAVGAHSVSNLTWTETGITWNNKPGATDPALSTQTITDNVARWYEFDVTAWVKPQRDGGQALISLALKSQAASTPYVIFDSREATNGRPQLLLWTTTSTRNALFAVGSSNLGNGDAAVKTRLEALGYTVTVQVANNGLLTSQADGKALVVISSTVNDGNVTNKFRHVAVPVVAWEPLVFDDMGMTGTTSNTHFGTLASQTQVNIVTPSHPMAAGLSSPPPVAVASPSSTFAWGKTNANAVNIAALTGDATKFPIFGYAAGANMPGADGVSAGLDAPSRRVALFMSDTTAFSNFGNTSGGALFDAAIKWAAEVVTVPTIISFTPPSGPVGTVVTITGVNFGITQGSSTLMFNGVAASPTSWNHNKIVAPVPIFSSTGPIVVTVNGVASNALIFSVGDVDSDSDGLPDWWEIQYFGNLSQTASGDPDGDSLTNLQEFQQGRNPTKNALADDGTGVNLRLHTPLAPSTP
jgi:hypothetical protein